MKKLLKILLLLLTFIFVCGSVKNKLNKISSAKNKSYITYGMYHPLHEWEGKSQNIKCNIAYDFENKKVEQVGVVVKVSSFDSGNSNRDSHALEVLDALKYPNVTFLSEKIEKIDEKKYNISGELEFHGKTRKIKFIASRKSTNSEEIIEGKFTVKLTNYNINKPSFMLVPVRDELSINFKIVFDKKED